MNEIKIFFHLGHVRSMHLNLFTTANWPQRCTKYRSIHYAFANCADGLQIPKQSELHKRSLSKTMKWRKAAMKHAHTHEHTHGHTLMDIKSKRETDPCSFIELFIKCEGNFGWKLVNKSACNFYLSSMSNKDCDITFLAGDTRDLIKNPSKKK